VAGHCLYFADLFVSHRWGRQRAVPLVTIEMTVHPMAATQNGLCREALAADRHCVRATGMKTTARRRRNQTGSLTAPGRCQPFAFDLDPIRVRRCADQQLRVWVLW